MKKSQRGPIVDNPIDHKALWSSCYIVIVILYHQLEMFVEGDANQ